MASCETCFYAERGYLEAPCSTCDPSGMGENLTNWVDMKVFDKVDNAPFIYNEPWGHVVSDLSGTPKQGVKYDDGKARWELIPFRAMRDVVDVLTYGSRKYADDNWKIVPDARKRYISAAFRHLTDWAGGEKKDSETGKSHLAHAICCLLFLLWFEQEDEK